MEKRRILVVFLITAMFARLSVSCTYDYFVDETNYKVFVPEVANGSITTCFVAVYDEAGTLVRTRRTGPLGSDPRVTAGIFSFRLQPGKYTAYCYANVNDMEVMDAGSSEQAFLALKRIVPPVEERDSQAYALPPEVVFQKLTPTIGNTFEQLVDTATLERFVGRITVRLKNLPFTLHDVTRVQLEATGVATRQYFSRDTLTSRLTENDYIFNDSPLAAGSEHFMEMDHYYFPSIADQLMRLNIRFLNAGGEILNEIPVEVIDTKTALPLPLLRGKRIILEIDSYTVVSIGLVGWNEEIKNSDREI
ncbi:MAG: FimB/Mfa2 family fimbrial subunit [Odoribacteraceae bacterium]|jgi:hypothetical protein|nr:FimB/Mfa2 family fimbrial subunit [Odoribacteraceae bacterium]